MERTFRNRHMKSNDDVYEHNAWDDVEWSKDMVSSAEDKISSNSKEKVPLSKQDEYEKNASSFWDRFYETHKDNFFKDRHWLFTEFPELSPKFPADKSSVEKSSFSSELSSEKLPKPKTTSVHARKERVFLEVGCGAGNTVFPILQSHDENTFLYCCDFSKEAISLIKNNPCFDAEKCHPFVLDITDDTWDVPFPQNSIDCIILIFVLSAIHPDKFCNTINNVVKYLKPGGSLLFRDYGQYDMVQLRFKPGQCLLESFYVRQDGTRVYFFTKDFVHNLFSAAGLTKKQLIVDRRLQVNRGKRLSMYRVWVQAVYIKELPNES